MTKGHAHKQALASFIMMELGQKKKNLHTHARMHTYTHNTPPHTHTQTQTHRHTDTHTHTHTQIPLHQVAGAGRRYAVASVAYIIVHDECVLSGVLCHVIFFENNNEVMCARAGVCKLKSDNKMANNDCRDGRRGPLWRPAAGKRC